MKIAFVASQYPPARAAVAVRAEAIVGELRGNGHRVTVFVGEGGERDDDAVPIRAKLPRNTQGFLARTVTEIIFALNLAATVLRSGKWDIVVVSSPPFIMTSICAAACRIWKIAYFLDVRDRYPEVLFSLGLLDRDKFPGRMFRRLEAWLYSGAAGFCTVTGDLADSITVDTGWTPLVAMNGFDEALFDGITEKQLSRPYKIVMHGTFGKFFDVRTFVLLLKGLEKNNGEFIVTVIGSGPKLGKLKELDSEILEVLPAVSPDEIPGYLSVAHIGLSIHINSRSMLSAFPVKVMEYIGAGLPTVVIPRSTAGKIVNDEGFGYSCDPDNIEDAIDFIMDICSNPESYERYRSE